MGVCVSKADGTAVTPEGSSEAKEARLSVIVESNQQVCKECHNAQPQCTCTAADSAKPTRRESMEFEVLEDGVRVNPAIQDTLREASKDYSATPAMKKLPTQGSGIAWGEVETQGGKKVKHTPVTDLADVSGA